MNFPPKHPLVVGSITTASGLRLLARGNLVADVCEVRVDALLAAGVSVEKIEGALKSRGGPVLLTLRIPAEGGHWRWRPAQRQEIFLRLLPIVEAIDIELASIRAMQPVIEAARRTSKTVIYSAHALARPATPTQFKKWLTQFPPGPSSILKMAGQIQSWRDLQQLAGVLINHPEWSVAVMGLGQRAAQSRSVLAALGSRLVYGYLDRPAAPGQPSAREVRKLVEAMVPL